MKSRYVSVIFMYLLACFSQGYLPYYKFQACCKNMSYYSLNLCVQIFSSKVSSSKKCKGEWLVQSNFKFNSSQILFFPWDSESNFTQWQHVAVCWLCFHQITCPLYAMFVAEMHEEEIRLPKDMRRKVRAMKDTSCMGFQHGLGKTALCS